jgi:plastocyanin
MPLARGGAENARTEDHIWTTRSFRVQDVPVRHRVLLATLVALVATVVPRPALAVSVSIVDFGFDPSTVGIGQGDSVIWTNTGSVTHTSTQDGPLAFWDTGRIPPGSFGEVDQGVLVAAGTYPYHCTIHPSMHGVVKVKLKVDRTQGTTSTVFTFTLSSSPQSGYVYDVQMKTGSGSWHSYASGVMTTTFAFQAQAAGTYRFRSRLHRSSDGATSGWSPARKIVVS